MPVDLDTFLVGLYTVTDDLYREHFQSQKPPRRGKRPELSDSEVLTLTLVAQWLGRSERALVRHAVAHWRGYFPRLLSQSAYNRRVRDLAGVLVQLVPKVAAALGAALAAYQAVDTVPVPLARRCRGRRRRLFGDEASVGRGGSDRDWYFGCKLLVAATPEGVVTGFVLAPASTEDRWVADALWCWRVDPEAAPWTTAELPPSHRRGGGRVGPTGPMGPRNGAGLPSPGPYVADRGFRGAAWVRHWWTDYGAAVLTPDGLVGAAQQQQAARRHVVETVQGVLTAVFHLAFPGARTRWGLVARVAAKLAAFNLGVLLNRHFGRPPLALATLFT